MLIHSRFDTDQKYFQTDVDGTWALWTTDWTGVWIVVLGQGEELSMSWPEKGPSHFLRPNLTLHEATRIVEYGPLWDAVAREYVVACRTIRDRPQPACGAIQSP